MIAELLAVTWNNTILPGVGDDYFDIKLNQMYLHEFAMLLAKQWDPEYEKYEWEKVFPIPEIENSQLPDYIYNLWQENCRS